MTTIQIKDRIIGEGHPAYIIAEIGVNHNGFLQLALDLIDKSVEAGVDAVKFQKRSLEKLYPKRMLENVNMGEKNMAYMLPILQQVELSDMDYARLVEYCQEKGVTFLCSAFDADSAAATVEPAMPRSWPEYPTGTPKSFSLFMNFRLMSSKAAG